jgi:hypothetical protein
LNVAREDVSSPKRQAFPVGSEEGPRLFLDLGTVPRIHCPR